MDKTKLFENFWTIPNMMSLVRLALAPVVAHCIYHELFALTIILLVFAGLLDIFDGIIARKFNQTSEFGKLIDPLADKVMYAFIVVTMLFKDLLPFWYVILFVGRDLLILLGSLIFSKKVNEVPQADNLGKASIFMNALAIFLILCGVHFINGPILGVLLLFLYISTFNYFKKGVRLMNNSQ